MDPTKCEHLAISNSKSVQNKLFVNAHKVTSVCRVKGELNPNFPPFSFELKKI